MKQLSMIENFLELYANSFLSFSASEIVENYDFPAIFHTEDAEVVIFTKDNFLLNSEKLLNRYKSLGVGQINFEILNTLSVSNKLDLVLVLWNFNKKNGSVIYSAKTNYLLKRCNNEYKITSVIMVNENDEFSEIVDKKI